MRKHLLSFEIEIEEINSVRGESKKLRKLAKLITVLSLRKEKKRFIVRCADDCERNISSTALCCYSCRKLYMNIISLLSDCYNDFS